MAITTSTTSICLVLACLVSLGEANALRKAAPAVHSDWVRIDDVEASLLAELAGAVGHGSGEAKLKRLVSSLRPMYDSLPKSEGGGLDHAAVRYALHRFFVKQHGWFVKGLDPEGAARNTSTGVDMLKARVPAYIEGLFEERLGGRGFGLQELAILVATLEHLVHDEAIQRLQGAYQAFSQPITGLVGEEELAQVIEAYMAAYIMGGDLASMASHEVSALKTDVVQMYPGWSDTQAWLHDVQTSVLYNHRGETNPFVGGERDFAHSAQVVEQIGEQYGRFQDLECRSLKTALLEREGDVPGRVPLSQFFKKDLDGNFLFTESVQYLRKVGALDESNPQRPSVIVPNYLTSPSNCLATSSFYSVCCLDECESLMAHLESEIGAPTATPGRIAELAAVLSSDTVDAPRTLSAHLMSRLEEIAQGHQGDIPLHGRLFAQWMHHVYPRECPYPHVAGTTSRAEDGDIADTATEGEMIAYTTVSVEHPQYATDVAKGEALPWSSEEELLTTRMPAPASYSWSAVLGNCLLLAALASIVVSLMRDTKSALLPIHGVKGKYSV